MSHCKSVLFSQEKAGSEWVGAVPGRKQWRRPGGDSPPCLLWHPAPPASQAHPRWALISLAGGQPVLIAPEDTKGSLYDLVIEGRSGQHCCSWSGPDETRALTGEQRPGQPFPASLKATEQYFHSVSQDG